MRPKDLKAVVKLMLDTNQNLLISGAPGIGKTDIAAAVAREVCAEKGGQFMVLHPVCDDPSDWKGLGFPAGDRKSAEFLPFGNLRDMIETKSRLICLIDDVGQAPESVQAAIMQVVRERRINGLMISPECRFILCTNRRGDKAGVRGIIEPLKSRCVIVDLEVNDDDWRLWANEHGMPPELVAFSKLRPGMLHDFKPSTDITNSANPRGWGEVGRIQLGGAPKHLEFELFRGCCGEQFAAEYTAFLRTYRDMPDPDIYLSNPDAELPGNESTLYALASALAYKATRKTVEAIFKVAMRLEAEYSTFLVFSMVQRDNNMSKVAGMAAWAQKYAPYLL
jgi:putative hemolysin